MLSRRTTMRIVVLAVLFALASSLVSAEPPDAGKSLAEMKPLGPADRLPYQYMVKYQCGWLAHIDPTVLWNAPGGYQTEITVHNFTTTNLRIYKRPTVSGHERSVVAPPILGVFTYVIKARRSLYIDCDDIYWMTGVGSPVPITGMLQLSLGEKLPVVATYTSAALDVDVNSYPDSGPSVHVEQYEPFVQPR